MPTRVLAFANYDLKQIQGAWEADGRNSPSHHLWGSPELEELGYEVEILEFKKTWSWKGLAKLNRIFGDLELQWSVWRKRASYEVLYCAHHPTIHLLALLRRVGLYRKPIVAVTYQAPKWTGVMAWAYVAATVRGCDRLISLSDAGAAWYAAHGMPRDRLATVMWGFDMPFYTPQHPPAREVLDFLATGKTYRDFGSLIAGFPVEQASLTICSAGNELNFTVPAEKAGRVNIIKERLNWQDFGRRVAQANAIVVPLDIGGCRTHNAIGLTAVLEALSMGVPVVVTRNAFLGLDVDAEGVGVTVHPNDPDDWRRVISSLAQDPARLAEMRVKARALAEARLNIKTYAQGVADAIAAVK